MKQNKKATMLIELSVLILCSMIFFIAISDMLNSRYYMVKRLVENNSVMMVLESIADKIQFDLKNGIKPQFMNIYKYENMIKNDNYKLKIRINKGKIEILLGVYYKEKFGSISIPQIKRIYKKEVAFYEE